MGGIQIGDHVIGSDGKPTLVTGVFPQGIQKVFKVMLRDGSWCECTDDHLWAVNDPQRNRNGRPLRVLTLREIRKTLYTSWGTCRHFVPLVKPIQYEQISVPLNPYLMGYLIANGCLRQLTPSISIPDKETVSRIIPLLPHGVSAKFKNNVDYYLSKTVGKKGGASNKNPLTVILQSLGLMGKGASEKFIPPAYIINSIDNRIALLQGLMDGDGYADKTGGTEYSTASKKLARQVQELVESLGGSARFKSKIPTFTYKGETKVGKRSYTIRFALPNDIQPFRLKRKADRATGRVKYKPSRAVIAVEYVGEKECQCIKVSAKDQLYVTNRHILTHNTLISLLWAKRNPHVRPIVVVCPASVKWNWEREASIHFGMLSEVLSGMKPSVGEMNVSQLYIINYDILKPWLPFLQSIKPQLVILDEIHYIANQKTKRCRYVRQLCNGVQNVTVFGVPNEPIPHILGLSGTPITNRPSEIWSGLNLINPKRYPSFWSFAQEFCSPKLTPWGWDFSGASNLGVLHKRLLKTCMIRRLKSEVLQELPAKRRAVVPMEMDNKREYTNAVKDFYGWLAQQSVAKANKARNAEALVKVGYLKRLAASLKLASVMNWIDDFMAESEEKIVLFAVHKVIIEALAKRYHGQCVVVDGSVVGQDRQRAVDAFQKSSKVRVFIGNIKAAGVGITLTAASTGAFIELGWTPGEHVQAEDRLHRLTQKNAVMWWYLIAKDSIEEKLCGLIQQKMGVLDQVLDGKTDGESLDIFDLLLKSLEEEAKK